MVDHFLLSSKTSSSDFDRELFNIVATEDANRNSHRNSYMLKRSFLFENSGRAFACGSTPNTFSVELATLPRSYIGSSG